MDDIPGISCDPIPDVVRIFLHDTYLQPDDSWNTLNGFEKVSSWSVNLFLLVISFIWFKEISKGLLKALRGSKGASDEANGQCSDQAHSQPNGHSNGKGKDQLRRRIIANQE
eukprot:CAMPEP_0170181952 /NCGR_PEP_ID=MMETSP0040_2-20121228/26481_1 /TAXON_ID=641309 /ORGANISM="Lotharella oceanica, Strain CCMP622" /LENGTH=111 /DNA_ID=CAMNT_0010427177 /DNA_START=514 /DNA_END=850 /DNA_ORIENTATION=-